MLNLSHKNLDVYKISLKLIKEIYKVTKAFPKEELYVLISQIRGRQFQFAVILLKELQEYQKKKKNVFMKFQGVHLVEIDTQFEIAIILRIL